MTKAEKLRFLADRMENGKKFYIATFSNPCFFNEGGLIYTEDDDGSVHATVFKIDTIIEFDFSLKPQLVFTEDEKVILRNLSDEFQWIARDEACDGLYAYKSKPWRSGQNWLTSSQTMINLCGFKHLFRDILWLDEPVEFRKYL